MTRLVLSLAVLTMLFSTGGVAVEQDSQQPPAGSPHPSAQQPPITFRADINYVEVDARVLDQQGAFVPSLKAGDFQVFEDGKPQPVTVFSLVNIPVERAERPLFASKPIEPDPKKNLPGAEGRIYLLVLDDYHTSFARSSRTKAAARQFIERYMGANDTAAWGLPSGRVEA